MYNRYVPRPEPNPVPPEPERPGRVHSPLDGLGGLLSGDKLGALLTGLDSGDILLVLILLLLVMEGDETERFITLGLLLLMLLGEKPKPASDEMSK